MIDSITGEPIRISEQGAFSPFIRLPLDQPELVKQILIDAAIRHSATGPIITYQGQPPITKIYLGYDTDIPLVRSSPGSSRGPQDGHRGEFADWPSRMRSKICPDDRWTPCTTCGISSSTAT